jgi:hypothetical protein
MVPATLVNFLNVAGFTLQLDGDRLTITPGDRLTDRLRSLIRCHKPHLVAYLRESHYRWFIRNGDGRCFVHGPSDPPTTHDQMTNEFPDALEIEPEVDHEEPQAEIEPERAMP